MILSQNKAKFDEESAGNLRIAKKPQKKLFWGEKLGKVFRPRLDPGPRGGPRVPASAGNLRIDEKTLKAG